MNPAKKNTLFGILVDELCSDDLELIAAVSQRAKHSQSQ
jgi:hypothetical protein